MAITQTQKNTVTTIPKLRFKNFRGAWIEKKLGELFIERSERKENKEYNLLSITLNEGIKSQGLASKRDGSSEDKTNYKVVRVNDIAYNTMRMWQGASGVSGLEGIVSPAYTVVTLRDGSVDFFKHLFKQPRTVFNFFRYSQGMTSDTWNLKFQQFSEVSVTIPETKDEQAKIALFLDTVDVWLGTLRKEKKLLQQYKKGTAQEIFSQSIRFKDKNGKDFPAWKEMQLGSMVTFSKGKGISKEDIVVGGKNKCIRYGELYTTYGEVIRDIFSTTNVSTSNSILSKTKDLLIPSSGETALDIARVSCVGESGVILGGDITVMRLSDHHDGNFLAYYLTNFKKREIARLAQGHSVVHLYSSHLRDLVIRIPELAEQQIIADYLGSIDVLIEAKERQTTFIETWRQGLMQQLFI